MNSPVCVDASVVVRLLIDTPETVRVEALWDGWAAAERLIVAPSLLYYEVTNALYRYERAGHLTGDEVQQAIHTALALEIRVGSDQGLHLDAAILARRLGLGATYDAHYLALSQKLGAEFWTGDRRLAAAAKDSLPFVRSIF